MTLEPDDEDLRVIAGYLADSGIRAGLLPVQSGASDDACGEPTSLVLLDPTPSRSPAASPTGLSQAASPDLDDDDLLSGLL